MTIRYNCVKCGQLLKIKDDLAGTPNKCPTCKTKFIVPSPSSVASTSDSQPNIISKPDDLGTSGAVPVVAAVAPAPPAAAGKEPDSPPAAAPPSPPKPPADEFDPTDVLMAGGPRKAPAKAAAPEKKAEDFDPTDVLMGDGPKKPVAKPAATAAAPAGAASAAPAAEKKDDFDPADFLMEGKPKKAVVPAPSPAKSAPAAKKSDPAVAAVAEAPAAAAPAPEGDPNFDPADFLMAEKAKAEAPPEPPKGPPGPGAPPAPRRWGAKASTAPPASAAAAAAGATLAAVAPAVVADPNLADMPAAQPTMVKLPQETKREPIDIRKAIRAVGWRRWSLLVLSLGFSTGLYWYLNQPKLEVPPLGQVSGVVTLDGKPVPGATVYFAPEKREYKRDKVSRGLPLRTATGLTDADGRYSLTYVDTVSGTFLGTNRVSVQAILDEKGKNKVPTTWGRESKNTVDVVEGANRQFDIVMKSGK